MSATQPKYGQIINKLVGEIRDGTYQTGDMLPTEPRLMEAFGVSRHTVRQALQGLKQMGLIQAQQGKGSVIIAKANPSTYVEMIQSIEALIAKGGDLDRRLIMSAKIKAEDELAQAFATKMGREFTEIHLVRHSEQVHPVPVAYLKIWVDPEFSSLARELENDGRTVAEIMKLKFGMEIGSIRQSITAISLSEEVADKLDRPAGEPALQIERLYSETTLALPHLRTISICRGDLVQIDSHFQSQ